MSTQNASKLVSKSCDLISIDKTVVENIDELFCLVTDTAIIMEADNTLHDVNFNDCGILNRTALNNLNSTLTIFDAIGAPGERINGSAS